MGAGNGIIAGRRIEGIVAGPIALRIQAARTNIVGTHIPIITRIGRAYACTRTITGIGMGAAQGVIARHRIIGIVASSVVVRIQAAQTDIVGTDITIITAVVGAETCPEQAGIRMGATHGIIAGGRIEGIVAGPDSVRIQGTQTDIIGTDVAIITGIGGTYACTLSITGIRMGATHGIITGILVERIVTGPIAFRIQAARTDVVGADIRVIALVERAYAGAPSITGIGMGTLYLVVAGSFIKGVGARAVAQTDIIRTDIPVITVVVRTQTGSEQAGIGMGAGLFIATRGQVERERTGAVAVANIIRADITVFTAVFRARTRSATTYIRMGASYVVITGIGIVREGTGGIPVTDVIGA